MRTRRPKICGWRSRSSGRRSSSSDSSCRRERICCPRSIAASWPSSRTPLRRSQATWCRRPSRPSSTLARPTRIASFHPEPLACASVGQAHLATLHDGTEVVVKVRRPNVVEEMDQDFEIIQNFAARASRRSKTAARYDLDRACRRVRADAPGPARLPPGGAQRRAVRRQLRGRLVRADPARLLGPDHLPGDHARTDPRDEGHRRRRARRGRPRPPRRSPQRAAQIVAKMVFEDGFFHADPHPGNFFIEPDGRIGIVDFGMVGTLDDALREQLSRLLTGFLRQDPDRLADALLALGTSTEPVDRARLREDLAGLLERYFGRSIGEISLRSAIGDVLEIVRRHRLRLPRDLALLLDRAPGRRGTRRRARPRLPLRRGARALCPSPAPRPADSRRSPAARRAVRRRARGARGRLSGAARPPAEVGRVRRTRGTSANRRTGVPAHARRARRQPDRGRRARRRG